MASYANISADQGADFQISIGIEDANGDPLDLTDYELFGQVRKSYKSESYVEFTITTAGTPSLGVLFIELTDEQTATMKAGRYVYDVYALDNISGSKIKLLEGILELIPSVTKNIGS